MSTVYSGVDFVCIRRASVKQGQSLLGYELLVSKRYPVTLMVRTNSDLLISAKYEGQQNPILSACYKLSP